MKRIRWTLAGVLGLGFFPIPWDLFPLVIPAAQAQTQNRRAAAHVLAYDRHPVADSDRQQDPREL